jgi:hypothetical protein
VGQTHFKKRRDDVSIAGLLREAIDRALEDAELSIKDVDAVVIGKAPDAFEGIVMPEIFLADAVGATNKPLLRVHTAGSVGGSTCIVGAHHVIAGIHGTVLDWDYFGPESSVRIKLPERPEDPRIPGGGEIITIRHWNAAMARAGMDLALKVIGEGVAFPID